jgi:8-oxo-dGTP pyrophosphatase MutT (NUDIX family)
MPRHRVYVNDVPLDFIPRAELPASVFITDAPVVSEEAEDLHEMLLRFSDGSYPNGLNCICEDAEAAWRRWTSMYTLSVAAGGVVRHMDGRILLIFRRGKWDLPKGKLDYEETPEHAAVREVQEECGIGGLHLGPLLKITFHTYTEKKRPILKKTFWYAMTCTDTRTPVPQEEEDIEKVVWMTPAEIRENVFPNTYRSVREVLECSL